MDCFRLESRRLRHPFGGATRWRAEQQIDALGAQDPQNRIHDGRLANAGAAGNDQNLRCQRQANGGDLACRQRQAGLLFHPGKRLIGVNELPRQHSISQGCQSLSDNLFGSIETG